MSFLIVARLLQGGAGAMMTPQVLAILRTTYAGERRARAFAAYGMTMGNAEVLGQLLGGLIIQADVDGSSWRGIFLINVPVGIAGLRMTAGLGRQILALGALVTAAGSLLMVLTAGTGSAAELLPGLAVAGFGMGMVLVPLSATVLRDVPASQAGSASGVLATFQQVSGALGSPSSEWCSSGNCVHLRPASAGSAPRAFASPICRCR